MSAVHERPDNDLRVITLEAFHQAVRAVHSTAAAPLPPELDHVMEQGRLLPWAVYAVSMFELDISTRSRRHVAGLWRAAAQVHRENGPPLEPVARSSARVAAYQPAVAMSDIELRATTEAEFVELLRLVQLRSGCSSAEIGQRAGIPRSQAYALVRKGRDSVPTKLDQLRAFLVACGLPEAQVRQVLRLWATLRDAGEKPVYGNAAPIANRPVGARPGSLGGRFLPG